MASRSATALATADTSRDGKKACVSVIIVAPALGASGARLTSRFDAFLDEQLLVQASKTPFLDAAREMLRLGFAPETRIVMRHQGATIDSLRAQVGAAARLTVADPDKGAIHFQLWKAFPVSAVPPPIARTGQAATSPQPSAFGPHDASRTEVAGK